MRAQTKEVMLSSEKKGYSGFTSIVYPLHLEAISVGLTAYRSLGQERIGRVHSVFRRVFNILTHDNRLISVVRRDVGQGPINIVTNLPQHVNMTSIGIKRNYEVLKVNDQIIVGDNVLIISFNGAGAWNPQRDFRANLLPIEAIRNNLITMKKVVCSYGCLDGLAQLLKYAKNEHPETLANDNMNLFARTALPHITNLLKAIRAGNSQDIERNAKKLIGLGPGLTPSGDDVLSGLMISLAIMAENLGINTNFVSKVNKHIGSCVHGRTTLISQELLMHASAGEGNEPIMTLIEKILTAKPDEVESVTRDILAIGATSGTDILLGVSLGAQLLLDDPRYLYN